MVHQTTAKRILRYLAGTKSKGIIYQSELTELQGSNPFYGYVDAAYANADDYHSTSGYIFLASSGAITWGSRKQTIITLSSTEAEYVALSEAARETKWLAALYAELGYQPRGPITILGDNNRSIAMATNPQFHKWLKHIAIRYHWIREQISQNILQIHQCCDPQQTADILTKALTPDKHNRHTIGLGISMA
jgi:hypothetical protein